MYSAEVLARFWSKVDTTGGPTACWPWTASLSGRWREGRGYGQLSIDNRLVRATHISWELAHPGEKLNGQHVLHECDNPPCVNPSHLHAGNDRMNAREAVERRLNRNVRKTHCPQGHEYAGTNLYAARRGDRQCKTCMRDHHRQWMARKRREGT